VVRLTGNGHEGQGEDITWDQIDQIEQLRDTFRDMVMGTTSPDADEVVSTMGSLRALSGVCKFPARVKCALLAWNALESAMAERSD